MQPYKYNYDIAQLVQKLFLCKNKTKVTCADLLSFVCD